MTERRREAVSPAPHALAIGRSEARWSGDALTLDIDEAASPIPRRMRGRIDVRGEASNARVFTLDEAGGHWWRPILPIAEVEVAMGAPAFAGAASAISTPTRATSRWSAAFPLDLVARGDKRRRDHPLRRRAAARGPALAALAFDRGAGSRRAAAARRPAAADALGRRPLDPRRRRARADPRRFEDTPFYARSLVAHALFGEEVASVHESLSLDRFANPARAPHAALPHAEAAVTATPSS